MLLLFGCLFMTIDHIGFLFYPDVVWFGRIGRLALPLFCFQTSISLRLTSSKINYLKRLFFFALVAEIPYLIFFGSGLNILFMFSFCVLLVVLTEKNYLLGLLTYVLVSALLLVSGQWVYLYYITLTITLYLFYLQFYFSYLLFMLLSLIFYAITLNVGFIYGLLSVFVIDYVRIYYRLNLGRYFFYLFYPIHFLILKLVRYAI